MWLDEDRTKGMAGLSCASSRERGCIHSASREGAATAPWVLGMLKASTGRLQQRLVFWGPSLLGVQGILWCLTGDTYGQRRSYTSA